MDRVSVNTPCGELIAEVGADSAYPEIFLYIRRPDGREIDLACLASDAREGLFRLFQKAEPTSESWGNSTAWEFAEVRGESRRPYYRVQSQNRR